MGFTYDYYLTETQYEDTVTPTRSNLLMRALVLTEEDAVAYGQYLTPLPTAELNDLTYTRYTQDCADRRASACTTFEMTSAGFHAEATLDRANLMFFSVPYDDGFTAYVDGQETEILRVDEGLMAVLCPAGTVTIDFVYQPDGIRCNAICPGTIVTPMVAGTTAADMDADMMGAMATHSNLRTQPCMPEDVANIALFLASDESRALTGQIMVSDFGAML